jgi:MFS transporter, DHA1 family, multidrug resistance protein
MLTADSRRNIYILALTLMVVMLGFGVVIPIIPFYMESMGAGGTELGLLVASYAIMRLIFGPVWGSISDRVGRKPILMVGITGYGITMILFAFATQWWMLLVIRSLSGILSSATSPTTMAYVGDSTSEGERSRGMGILGAAIGIGTILGPGPGGLLAGGSLSAPFLIAGAMSFLTLALIWFFLPESLPAESRRKTAGDTGRPKLRDLWGALFSPIGILLVMAFLLSYAMTTVYGILGLYLLEKYHSGPQQVGAIMMIVGAISAVAQGGLTGPMTKRWGEATLIKAGLAATALGFAGISLSASFAAFLVAVGVFTLATALMTPAVSSLTSQRTTMAQGITMGLSNAFMSLGRIAGPAVAGVAFDANIEAPFLLGAVVTAAGFVVSLLRVKANPRDRALTTEAGPGAPLASGRR